MSTQIKATITQVNSSQIVTTVMSFPSNDVIILQNDGQGSIINYFGNKFYATETVSSLANADFVVATVVAVNGSIQSSPFTCAFPIVDCSISSSNLYGANSCIKYEGSIYYVSESLSALVTVTSSGTSSGTTSSSYKVYAALFKQTGTSVPTVTVLENTIDPSITWGRAAGGGGSVGYQINSPLNAFTQGKTIAPPFGDWAGTGNTWLETADSTGATTGKMTVYRVSDSEVDVWFNAGDSGTLVSADTSLFVEIRVYS